MPGLVEKRQTKVPKIRFKEGDVEGYSEPLRKKDHWVLYYFENHAVNCEQCESPYDRAYKRRGFLCKEGLKKATDVADLLFKVKRRDETVYRIDHDTGKQIRIEVPKEYLNIRQLLKAIKQSQYAILDKAYDRTYPVQARTVEPSTHDVKPMDYPIEAEQFREFEPERRPERKKSHRSKPKSAKNPAKNSYGSNLLQDLEAEEHNAHIEQSYTYEDSEDSSQYLPINSWSVHYSQDPYYAREYA